MSERIQKVLARLGLGSRRQIEEWIRQGRIKLDGDVATLGTSLVQGVRLSIDGKPVNLPDLEEEQATHVLLYHKKVGVICTRHDPEGRPTVFADVPTLRQGRWVAIGRLDINTSGLLLFTNNGELANRLMHPSYGIEREYAVRVLGEVSDATLSRVRTEVTLDDGVTKFDSIRDAGGSGANHWYHVVLKEGRNREVRRIWEAVGHKVSRLHRVRYGRIELPRSVRPGKFERLPFPSILDLMASVDLKGQARPKHAPSKNQGRRRTRG
ncbi:MAG: pseudouridine synthase [Gammaproteobacteria bacterium]|nr:pseudouridine synthase [Gammaproteobacteria bacterium]